MSKILVVISTLLLTKVAFGSTDFKCRKKYTAISCNEVKDAQRTHLCLKYPDKLTHAKKEKWCKKTAKKASKKINKLSMK